MNELTVRMASLEDAKEILSIYEPYIINTPITFETELIPLEAFRERMEKVMTKFPWLVCEINGRIVGYAYASTYRERAAFAWDCESSVYVSEEAHRKGVATLLYNELFEQLRKLGYYNVYAFITYPHDSSVMLHRKFQFREVGMFYKTGYKLGKWWDLVVMEKALQEFPKVPQRPRMRKELI